MPNPVKLQFAFQGGGAKIIALLAVAEVIQEFERSGKIIVTRVSGTSAGSIVASFIGAGIRAESIVAELRGGAGLRLVEQFKVPGKFMAFCKLFVKQEAIWDPKPLRDWLVQKFAAVNVAKVGDITRRIPLLITRTDLGSRACGHAPDSDGIADAIIDSCALPYLFRIWSRTKGNTFVDGGISNNLPAGYLADSDTKHGELVAVSFADGSTEHPKNFLTFSLALLDSAISSTMGLTKQAHKESLMEIRTRIGTFDFSDALAPEFVESYESIKLWAAAELQRRLDRIRVASQLSVSDPWKETNPTAVRVMQLIGDSYNRSLGTNLLPYDSCKLIVYSNAGRPSGDPYGTTPDKAQFKFVFHSGTEPTYCISVGLVGQSNESVFAADSADCVVTDPRGSRLDFIKIPIRTESSGTRELCLFFTPALPPLTGPYTVDFEENGENLMAGLFANGEDELGYHPQRPDGPVGRVDLALFVHKDIKVLLQSKDPLRPGAHVPWQKVISGSPLFPNMTGYCMFAKDVDKLWVLTVARLH
jgi:predicted acylesterase/phospholipase RssA